jgi:glutaredoxin
MKASPRTLWTVLLIVLAAGAASQWWGRRHEQALGRDVAAQVQPGDIRMISSQTCAICALARQWFAEHRIAFDECLVERDERCRRDYEALGMPGTPVIVVRGQPQVGFSPQRLQAALARQPRG